LIKAQIIQVIWSFYLKASIEATPQETEYCLVLTVIRRIIDAYSRAKEDKVGLIQ